MNSAIASNINGGVSNQQVANGSHSSLLSSSIEFSLTEVKTNFSASSYEGKCLIKLAGKVEIFYGQNKSKNQLCDQNKAKTQLCDQNIDKNQLSDQSKAKNQLCDQNQDQNDHCDQSEVENNLCDQNKTKIHLCDQNKNPVENNYISINGNKEKSSEDTIPIPKVQLYTGKIDVEWNQVHKIGAGLHNLGNTCFMNTVMQCLTYCPPLANYLLYDNDHSSKCNVSGFCMMCLLQKHMKKAIGKTGEVFKPVEVYQRLKLIAKHFQYTRQEDAHEFLRYVIDHLWKSCLPQTNGVAKLDSASKETTVINKIFGGYHRSQVICLRCKKESNTFDHFMDFILDIKQNVVSLEKALEKFTQPELLQQENCYKCPKCKMKVDAQKRFSVYLAPTVATFQLKRFDYNRSLGGKITKQITYPEKLNLRPYMSDTQGDPVWYRLNAVLVHSGHSCNSGHYYCYVKNSNGYWYIMDDQRVHQVSLNQVLSQSAYVLFYIKMENSEKTALKKCLENKNTFIKGTNSNSHFLKASETSNLKSIPLSEKNSKSYGSPNSIKKFNISNQNREKVSFGLRTNGSFMPLTSPKNKIDSSEPATATHSGLVPYVEDSSESSDACDANLSQNKPSTVSNNNVKHNSKNGSLDSYRASPQLEIRAKLSKSVFGTPSPCTPAPKVSATGCWIVTDAPPPSITPRSSSTGVSSTTDWQVIEAPDLKLNDSLKTNISKRESSDSVVSLAETETSKHSASNKDEGDPPDSAKKSSGYESSPSAQKSNFRKQLFKNKTHFPEAEETAGNSSKRKYSDSYSKVSKDYSYNQHTESRHNPIPKKAKYAENSSFLNHQGNGDRNSSLNIDNSLDNSSVQRQYPVSHCDNNSRTSVVNGVFNSGDSLRGSSSKNVNFNGSLEKDKKDSTFFKGKSDNSFSESKHYGKEKLPSFHQGKNSSLYGTEVPTWRKESDYRPSIIPAHENRRSFSNYDHELDRGKVRKFKGKDRYQMYRQRNSFQKQANRYYDKQHSVNKQHSRKFYNNHHHNGRRYDPRHNWKQNHNGYQRDRNHHRHY